MKPFTGYIFLALAITCGIAANSFAKISDGFSKLTPTIACLLLMTVTMFSLAKAMSVLPVAFSYSTYSGLTVAGVVLFGMLKYNQVPNFYGIIGIALIITGVIFRSVEVFWFTSSHPSSLPEPNGALCTSCHITTRWMTLPILSDQQAPSE